MISGFDPQPYFSSSTPMNSGNVQLKLRGYSLSRLLELGETIRRGVLRNRRIREVDLKTTENYFGQMEKVVFITPRRDELGRRGIRWSEVADRIARLAPRPGGRRTFRLGPEEYVFQLRSGHGGVPDLAGLRQAEIGLADGRRFRLPELAHIRLDTVSSAIDREDQAYVLLVAWDYLGSARAGRRFRDAVAANLYLPPGFELDTFNPLFMTREETRSVTAALALALGVIFLILTALYESPLRALLVFLVYPLGLIGALAGFVVFGMGFDSSAYIGLILASGIVVNIGILLMSHMELRVRETGRLFEGLVAGVAERFRAVGITTLTTLVGLFPFVIFQTNPRGDIWSSLALATFGGLISATLLVPLVLPVAYYGLMRRRTTRAPSPGWNDTTVPAAEPKS